MPYDLMCELVGRDPSKLVPVELLEKIRGIATSEYERGFNAPYKQIAELAQEALDA